MTYERSRHTCSAAEALDWWRSNPYRHAASSVLTFLPVVDSTVGGGKSSYWCMSSPRQALNACCWTLFHISWRFTLIGFTVWIRSVKLNLWPAAFIHSVSLEWRGIGSLGRFHDLHELIAEDKSQPPTDQSTDHYSNRYKYCVVIWIVLLLSVTPPPAPNRIN